MRFDPRQHITGMVYDLSQRNMNAMIAEIERLEEALLASEAREKFLRDVLIKSPEELHAIAKAVKQMGFT